MQQPTLTMAGQQALAGGARACAGSRVRLASSPAATPAVHVFDGAHGPLHSSKWTVDAIAEPTATYMVFDGKNRPTRQPSELSP